MEGSLIGQGIELLLYGMGTVIAFLTLLVAAVSLMSQLIERWYPGEAEAGESGAAPRGADPSLPAVLAAALHRHRRGRES